MRRIDLPGGWYLVMCDEPDSKHYRDWFLSTPDRRSGRHEEGVWVAKFWDGPESAMKCACHSADAHNCWALRYHGHTGVSELTVANEGGPCECACHEDDREYEDDMNPIDDAEFGMSR